MVQPVVLLTDVAEGDPDGDCGNLAVQSLGLLENSLKNGLDPAPLGLSSRSRHDDTQWTLMSYPSGA